MFGARATVCGWVAGVHPPGKKNDVVGLLKVTKNMLVGHAHAYRAIRLASARCVQVAGTRNTPPADAATGAPVPTVCLALSHILFTPCGGFGIFPALSAVTSVLISYLFNYVYWDALVLGRVAWPVYLVVWLLGWGPDFRLLKGTVSLRPREPHREAPSRAARVLPCGSPTRLACCANARACCAGRLPRHQPLLPLRGAL